MHFKFSGLYNPNYVASANELYLERITTNGVINCSREEKGLLVEGRAKFFTV